MAQITFVDPARDARWDSFVDKAQRSSIFHHSSWKKVIGTTFKAAPLYAAVEDGEKTIRSGIPFFLKKGVLTGGSLISLPFSDYCDLLTDDPEEFRALWQAVLDEGAAKGTRFVEIRTRDKGGIDLEEFGLKKTRTYLNHFLKVSEDLEFMEKKVIEKSYRYDIRQARKSGLELRSASTEQEMAVYYKLYLATRRHQGLPPLPYDFFRNVWNILSPCKMAYLFLAYWGEQAVAGILLLRHKNLLYALSNSSDRRFLEKKPNHLLWWKSIELAVELGLEGFDFGRTSHGNKGLRFFKTRWGAEEIGISHYRYGMGRSDRGSGRGRQALEKLFPPVLRRFPRWAFRLTGAIAYGHL